jgi:HSP20 family molecular chaperone IbpA
MAHHTSHQNHHHSSSDHSSHPLEQSAQITQDMMQQHAENARHFILEPMLSAQKYMHSMMQQTLGQLHQMPTPASMLSDKVMPKVKVWEDSDHFFLQTRVPDVDASDINVSVDNSTMTITCGSHPSSQQATKGQTLYETSQACRTIMIPDNADAQKAEAQLKEETLLIILPKKKHSDKVRTIPIKKAA